MSTTLINPATGREIREVPSATEAETDAAHLQIAPLVQPVERPERFLPPVLRDARPVIVDADFHRTRRAL